MTTKLEDMFLRDTVGVPEASEILNAVDITKLGIWRRALKAAIGRPLGQFLEELLDKAVEHANPEIPRTTNELFLVSVPVLDRADESHWIWQFTTRAEGAASLIDRLAHLLYEDEGWAMQRLCPDHDASMADCPTLDNAGYMIGDFTVVKLGSDLPPCSNCCGSAEHIDL